MKKYLRQLNIIPNTVIGALVLLIAFVTISYGFERTVSQEGFPTALVFKRKPEAWLSRLLYGFLPHWLGITLGQVVLINTNDAHIIQHELVHVRQQANLGAWFFVAYTWSSIRHGYWGNKYETEAYNLTEEHKA